MPSARTNLLCLPVELLEMVALHLEYAYEINCLSQTCRRLYSITNHYLFQYYAKECSPWGLERVVKNDNLQALKTLLQNGLDFDQYFHTTGYSSPILLTVDKDLSKIAELLVVSTDLWGGPRPGHHERDVCFKKALFGAASKGNLGATKVLTSSSTGVTNNQIAEALAHAVKHGQLALARYLIEERAVDVNELVYTYEFFCYEYCYEPPKTFLAMAAYWGNLQMVELLVMAGADLNHDSFKYITRCPLHIAAARNHATVEQYFIEKGMRYHGNFSDIWHVQDCRGGGYTPSNFFKGVDLSAILAPEYQRCDYYWRQCIHRVIASCNDLPAFQQIWNMGDYLEHLGPSFEAAFKSGSWTVARYIVVTMIELEGLAWGPWLTQLLMSTLWFPSVHSVPTFNMILDLVPPPDLPAHREDWLNMILNEAKVNRSPGHMDALLQRGYLDKTKDMIIVEELLKFAFGAGSLGSVWRLLKHAEFGPLDKLDDPDLEYHGQSVLHIAACCSSLETFHEFLSTQNITLDPDHPIHCSALVGAAVHSNIDVVGYFLGKGFGTNALHEASAGKENNLAEFHAAAYWASLHGSLEFERRPEEKITATVQLLLDHGAQIDTRNTQGQTALSIALETGNFHLVNMLLNRGADPLIGFESHTNPSVLEQLIRIFLNKEYNIRNLNVLQSCLEVMSAKGYKSDDFLSLMPSFEGTLSCPKVTARFENAPEVEGPMALENKEDKVYVRWPHFFLIRELRRHYWRAMYPVASE